MMPLRCGRMDPHPEHDWTTRLLGGDWPRHTYHCTGHVITEMQAAEYDAEDDAAEERAERDRREAS